MAKNKTGIAALDAMIKGASKKFGKDMGGFDWGDWAPLSTGSTQLDQALYIGGIPLFSIIEIIGQESSNKTSFCLNMLAREQERRRKEREEAIAKGDEEPPRRMDIILDLERSMTSSFIKGFGVDLEQVLWLRPDTAEEALQVSLDYVKSGAIGMVILDSVDAMQNVKQQSRNVGETDVGGISKDMSFAIRQIAKLCKEYKTTYIFINQIRMNPGVMFGSPETTPGGKSLAFYASLRLKFMSRKANKDVPMAYNMRVQVKKTRCGPDFEGILELPFLHGRGFATLLDVTNTAKEFGILKHSAGQSKVFWQADGDIEDKNCWGPLMPDIDKGKAAAFQALEENPWLLEQLRQLCFYVGNAPNRMSLEEIRAIQPEEQDDTGTTETDGE